MNEVTVRTLRNKQDKRTPTYVMSETQITKDSIPESSVENGIMTIKKKFHHKSFEERLEAYGGKISIAEFDWGEPAGREII